MENQHDRADSLLQRTTDLLRNVLKELEGAPSTSDSNASTSGTSAPTPIASDDFRRAFPGLCSRNVVRPPMRRPGQPQSLEGAKKKKPNVGYVPLRFTATDTWTHEVVVLARCGEDKTPDRERSELLLSAGLGKAKVVFPNKKASHEEFQKFMEEKFPKLKVAGGFEVLRAYGGGGGQRNLCLLPPSRDGYSISHLKERLGQAIAYIRPLQVDLDESPLKHEETDSPKVTCINCHLPIPMVSIREHQMDCSGGSSHNSATLDDPQPRGEIEKFFITSSEKPKEESKKSESMLEAMFPDISQSEITSAICSSDGDVNRAAELLLLGQTPADYIVVDQILDTHTRSSSNKEIHILQDIKTIKEIMQAHRLQLENEGVNRLNVEREELWSDSIVLFKSSGFNPKYPLRIRFEGEAGIDAGGVSREYATLLRNALFSSEARLFEGQSDRKLPLYNGDAVLANLFTLAGKMCSYLITHCDVGIPCLSQPAYTYICTGDIEMASQKCKLEDIPDPDLQDIIAKVNSANTEKELSDVNLENFSDALISAGWVKPLNVANKDLAMWQLVVHETLLKRKTPLDQFIAGLKTLNLLQKIQSYPEQLSPYFIDRDTHLSKEKIISLFDDLESESYDEDKERCKGYFIQAISDLEKDTGEEGLKRFLSFVTGLDRVPPLGFPSKIELLFMKDDNQTMYAETCLFSLKLPTVHTEYTAFQRQFMLACNECSLGFGCA